jgi:hypothetical protein
MTKFGNPHQRPPPLTNGTKTNTAETSLKQLKNLIPFLPITKSKLEQFRAGINALRISFKSYSLI